MAQPKTFIVIPSMEGTDHEATIKFIDATFQVNNELVKHYPHPEFGTWLIEQIFDVHKVLAKKIGFFTKKHICPSCSTELDPDSRETLEATYELRFQDFNPFQVRITIPSVECPQCKKICGIDLKGFLAGQLTDAIIHSFESQGIKPF